MKPVYISPVSFAPDSYIPTVPCGAGMLSCLTGHTVEQWMKRIVNFRKRKKRYTSEYTHFYMDKGKYWSDRYTLYFTEAMHFLKPYKVKDPVEFAKRRPLHKVMKDYCEEDKTYVIWFDDPGHIAIIHNKEFWDNDSEGIPLGSYNIWYNYKITTIMEIEPKMHDRNEPLDHDEIDITPSDWICAA